MIVLLKMLASAASEDRNRCNKEHTLELTTTKLVAGFKSN